eukprot:1619172-Rhodomonas_salina.1
MARVAFPIAYSLAFIALSLNGNVIPHRSSQAALLVSLDAADALYSVSSPHLVRRMSPMWFTLRLRGGA